MPFYRMRVQLKNYLTAIALVTALAVGGCASAPVQQMSNARQAIKAAQDAGAAQAAPETLSEAQRLLTRAEGSLKNHFFRAARRDAVAAHAKAVEALQATAAQKDGGK